MLQVLNAARKAALRVFYALHHRYRPGDYETWKYIAPRTGLGTELSHSRRHKINLKLLRFLVVSLATAMSLTPPAAVLAHQLTAPKAKHVALVHRACAHRPSWSEVIPRLQAAGLNVPSVQNPLTTLPEAVDASLRVLGRQNGPPVLAGHSFSGMIVTEAGVHPNVLALVYVAARAPDAGEDYAALAKRFTHTASFRRHSIRWR